MIAKIEKIIQKYSDKKHSFVTGNGTSAIFLALKASAIKKGSKIAVLNIACPDPVYALIWAGYKPVFIDVNIDDYNMDTKKLEAELQINQDIKAIIAIHLFGNACNIVTIKKLAKQYNCFLLEDCAQAFGNEIKEGKLGSFGDVSIFSFGNGKIVEIGHGGTIQTNSKELLENIKREYKKLPKYNETNINRLSILHRKIYYKLYYLGMKYPRLNILNLVYVYFFKGYYLYQLDDAKLALILSKLESFNSDKINRVNIVNNYISELEDVVKMPRLNNKENILSKLTITISDAENISKNIRDNGIHSNTMYPMLIDRFKIFFNKKDYANSYDLKGRLLNLWTSGVDKTKIDRTVKIIKDSYE